MKKTALVLGLFVFTFYVYDKQDSAARQKNYHTVANTVMDETSQDSQKENSPVQLQKAGMSEMDFSSLQKALGKIDIANYAIESNTEIVLIETLNHNVNVITEEFVPDRRPQFLVAQVVCGRIVSHVPGGILPVGLLIRLQPRGQGHQAVHRAPVDVFKRGVGL